MSYGGTSYGSTTIGGQAASEWQTFFAFGQRDVGNYEAVAEFTGDVQFYSIFATIASDVIQVNFEALTHNDPDETPQSQVQFGGFGNYFQAVIGSARFIVVRASVPDAGQFFSVRGRPGD